MRRPLIMLLLIDTRTPPEPEPRRRRRRQVSPRAALVVAALVLVIAGGVVSGLAGLFLVLLGLLAGCRAAATAMPYGSGLSEHRQ